MKTTISYVGIDVSKTTLHVALAEKFIGEFDNKPTGHQKLIEKLKKLGPCLIILEASGGYEKLISDAMQDADLAVSVCQPSCIRHFAKSIKVLAKTDKIDAQVIARFGEAIKPSVTQKTPENVRKMRALSDRRRQVVEDRVREVNRLEACADPYIRKELENSIDQLKRKEKELEEQINLLIKSDACFRRKAEQLTAQKGVGKQTVTVLLAQLPELGTLSRQQVAALAGLAPYARESGKWNGKRTIYGGRSEIRKAMYMAARTAARWCPVISQFYKSLRDNGKHYKAAIIACARKMIVRLNTTLKEFDQKPVIGPATT